MKVRARISTRSQLVDDAIRHLGTRVRWYRDVPDGDYTPIGNISVVEKTDKAGRGFVASVTLEKEIEFP